MKNENKETKSECKNRIPIYYAHCKAIYGTPQEKRDVELLEKLGFEVVNPSEEIHEKLCREREDKMSYFVELVKDCGVLAFRSLPNGDIPVGVAKEIDVALEHNIPVIELPSLSLRRRLTISETKTYLCEIGER